LEVYTVKNPMCFSHWSVRYTVGKVAKEPNINRDTEEACGTGIHVAYLNWALDFGKDWDNFAIMEVEVDIDDIVMPFDTTGKVRVSQCKVLREVPLEECGVYGRVLAKKTQAVITYCP
jgi:hypothetical protein